MRVVVHKRVFKRHPEITKSDVEYAWSHYRHFMPRFGREPTQYMAIGFDARARPLEMLAVLEDDSAARDSYYLVFHAMRCSRSFVKEMGLSEPEIKYLFGGRGHGSQR
jgi:hypothetical protein